MTAVEKAEELLKKMLSKNPNIQDGISIIDTIQAKQCALIAVNEILGYMGADRGTEFWEQVKSEIEKL